MVTGEVKNAPHRKFVKAVITRRCVSSWLLSQTTPLASRPVVRGRRNLSDGHVGI